jgi:hypothetical protein
MPTAPNDFCGKCFPFCAVFVILVRVAAMQHPLRASSSAGQSWRLITALSYHLAFKSYRTIAFFQKLPFNNLFFGVKEAFSHYPMALFPIIGASSSVG